ncbi:hypothetical protein B0A55_04412 [Friedmanniomyces simplex]|uniref:NTF2-like domain-containing protein n=1 Tax=Friedmanniomyces simplex TaxID=329884 RepID=A0A4U0XGJ5_9PEZI|nr:hypothetical protein B0A55_04412 [Friedmanniomyces simplex]
MLLVPPRLSGIIGTTADSRGAPCRASSTDNNWSQCVTQGQANEVVNTIIELFAHAPGANALFADKLVEYSDSILALQGLPLTGSGFANNKAEDLAAVLDGHPLKGTQSLYVSSAGCHKIMWYFKFNEVAAAIYRVRGFELISLNNRSQICEMDIKFNSIAWGLDDGELKCNTTAKV